MAKRTRFAFRTTEEFKKRIADVAETLGLDQAVVGEAALEAVIKHVEKYGELTIPIQLERRPKKEDSRPRVAPHAARRSTPPTEIHGLNEPEGDYKTTEKGSAP